MRVVTAAEMRELDRLTIELGTPGLTLMERAGTGAVDLLLSEFPSMRRKGGRIVVLAGKGNNGGDGFVMARLLQKRGSRVDVFLLGRTTEVTGDAATNLAKWVGMRGSLTEVVSAEDLIAFRDALVEAELAVDALFGTGLNSPITGLAADAIGILNFSDIQILAVDLPSGLDADTGKVLGICIEADITATFGYPKIGQFVHPGASICGNVAVIDIGIAEEVATRIPARIHLADEDDVASLVPRRSPDAHKGHCGHLLVIAGSLGKTGAAQLVARAALRSGAGLVTVVGPASLHAIYATGTPEAMTDSLPDQDGVMCFDEAALRALTKGKTAVVVGPGIGTGKDAFRIVRWLINQPNLSVVVDADALTCVARDLTVLRSASARLVLTPHPGEMARLLGIESIAVQADRLGISRQFAHDHGCCLVLKGAGTITSAPDGMQWVNSTGNPGMASGGMGDALAGVIGALLAQGLGHLDAARLGVYIHGRAADMVAADQGTIGMIATDVIARIPKVFTEL